MNLRVFTWRTYQFLNGKAYHVLLRLPLSNGVIHQLRKIIWRLAPSIIPNPVLANGSQLYWHPSSYGDAVEYSLGKYESDTCQLFQKLVCAGMVTVDIGASIGYYTLLFAKTVGKNGRVYAFEPQPWNCDVLRKSACTNGYDNIVVVQKAVSNKSGEVELHFTEAGDGEASLYTRRRPNTSEQRIKVEAITLDEFFESEGWPPIHVIKMDVEGAEKAALEGMRQLVQRNPQLKLVMEFWPKVQAAAGVSPEELIYTLIEVGFVKFWEIQSTLKPLNITHDIPHLVQMARDGRVNILCEK